MHAASEREGAPRAEHAHRVSDSQGSELAGAEASDSRNRNVRQTRTRRAPKRRYDDNSPPPQNPGTGGVHLTATSRARDDDDAGGQIPPAAGKRSRGAANAPSNTGNHINGPVQADAQLIAAHEAAMAAGVVQTPQQYLINLRTQFENIMKALKDPRSLVNSIFIRAQERLRAMAQDAGMDMSVEEDRAVFNFALQACSTSELVALYHLLIHAARFDTHVANLRPACKARGLKLSS